MIAPRSVDLGGVAEAGYSSKRARVFLVERRAPAKMPQDERRSSGDEILQRDHRERRRPRQRRAELPEEINAKRLLGIDQLKQRLSFQRMWVDVMHEKSVRQ